ncbi:UDP-galactose transporter Gms1 [Tieghemiomyces parasiticus]|uniref:UDP-galactose transporter Gms1 n=1 Tax=Tieghemiomyces parasiticus TaxID=78921 RepID=A0A9W8A3D9_9FUNG|nr:UDP-galactose transporter Gms1 [Tieghemiomyces parasiticus]
MVLAVLRNVPMKYVSLVTLVVQNSALVLVMRYSRLHSGSTGEKYYTSTAVFLAELSKFFMSVGLLLYEEISRRRQLARSHHQGYELASNQDDGAHSGAAGRRKSADEDFEDPQNPSTVPSEPPLTVRWLFNEVFGDDAWKLMIPAALYTVQNNLQYIAVSLLDAATFQVTYQLKILTTALCFVIILRKPLNLWQWLSLVVLTVGIILVQLPSLGSVGGTAATANSGAGATGDAAATAGAAAEAVDKAANAALQTQRDSWEKLLGLLTVALACVMSGLAGVYFEKILKGSKTSVWARNIQLSFFSLFPALFLGVMLKDGAGVREHGFWYGYNAWTFGAITCQALGGIIVALVVKYADNILKGFATSISIILSCVASIFIFDFHITIMFVIGTAAVIYATYLYGTASSAKPTPKSTAASEAAGGRSLEQGRSEVVLDTTGLDSGDDDDDITVTGSVRQHQH